MYEKSRPMQCTVSCRSLVADRTRVFVWYSVCVISFPVSLCFSPPAEQSALCHVCADGSDCQAYSRLLYFYC